jgi:hypothetical protein
MTVRIVKLIVALAAAGIVAGFTPFPSRSLTRFSRLSMAFEFSPPSFDSFLKQFASAPVYPEQPVTVIEVVAPIQTVPIVVAQVISVSPSEPPSALSALSGGEFAVGLGLGLVPYLLIPVIALSAVKGLIKAPKPLPVPVEPTTTVGAYTKSLQEGLNEGIRELFSEQTADTELTKKGIKLSAGGFGVAIALTAVLFATTSAKEESKVIAKKPVAPAAIVKVITPPAVPAVAPVAPAVVAAPAVIVAPAPVAPKVDSAIVDKAAAEKEVADKAASEKAASEKAASDKAASDKAVAEKAASEKAAADKSASDKAVSEKAASDKAASDQAIAEKAVAVKAVVAAQAPVEEDTAYVPSVPKGMEPEKIDFAALKLLRVSIVTHLLITHVQLSN